MTQEEMRVKMQEATLPPVAVKVGRKITGYVCPRCGQMPGVTCGRPGSASDVKVKREWAARCCICACGLVIEGERRGSYRRCASCQAKEDAAWAETAETRQAEANARLDSERAVVNGPCPDAEQRLRALHGKWSYWDADVAFDPADFAACRAGAEALRLWKDWHKVHGDPLKELAITRAARALLAAEIGR